jgi:hypothetical protein
MWDICVFPCMPLKDPSRRDPKPDATTSQLSPIEATEVKVREKKIAPANWLTEYGSLLPAGPLDSWVFDVLGSLPRVCAGRMFAEILMKEAREPQIHQARIQLLDRSDKGKNAVVLQLRNRYVGGQSPTSKSSCLFAIRLESIARSQTKYKVQRRKRTHGYLLVSRRSTFNDSRTVS